MRYYIWHGTYDLRSSEEIQPIHGLLTGLVRQESHQRPYHEDLRQYHSLADQRAIPAQIPQTGPEAGPQAKAKKSLEINTGTYIIYLKHTLGVSS